MNFSPFPTRFPANDNSPIKIDSLPFKLTPFSGNPQDNPEDFINSFKLSAEVLGWAKHKQTAIFQMCLKNAPRMWFQQLDYITCTDIDKLMVAFMIRFKPLGLDWTKEASFQSLKQSPAETDQEFSNRVLERGTKIGKTEKDVLNRYIKGLHTA